MTRRVPGTWGYCDLCGKRRLARKPSPLCYRCGYRAKRHALTASARFSTQVERLAEEHRQLYLIEWHRAILMGHDMLPVEPDMAPWAFLSSCAACDGWLVGDPSGADEMDRPTPFYGRAYQTECAGAPPVPPANRRDIMDEAAPSTSLGREASDRTPPSIDRWQWNDPEDDPRGFNRRRKP